MLNKCQIRHFLQYYARHNTIFCHQSKLLKQKNKTLFYFLNVIRFFVMILNFVLKYDILYTIYCKGYFMNKYKLKNLINVCLAAVAVTLCIIFSSSTVMCTIFIYLCCINIAYYILYCIISLFKNIRKKKS